MEKIISDKKRKREQRDANIRDDFARYMKAGSDRTAVYKKLANEYDVSVSSVIRIVLSQPKKQPIKK